MAEKTNTVEEQKPLASNPVEEAMQVILAERAQREEAFTRELEELMKKHRCIIQCDLIPDGTGAYRPKPRVMAI